MRKTDDLVDRVDRSERIRHVHHRYESRSVAEQLLVRVKIQLATVADRDDAQPRALFLTEKLPRHDIRVVLQRRDDNFVAGADVRAPVGLGHEIDCLRGAPHEHDLPRLSRIEEPPNDVARCLIRVSRTLAEPVHAAMDVPVVLGVVPHQAIDDRLRLLSRGGIVQIHERLAVDPLPEDGEVLTDRGHVEGRGALRRNRRSACHGRVLSDVACGNCRSSTASTCSRSASSGILFSTSPANA